MKRVHNIPSGVKKTVDLASYVERAIDEIDNIVSVKLEELTTYINHHLFQTQDTLAANADARSALSDAIATINADTTIRFPTTPPQDPKETGDSYYEESTDTLHIWNETSNAYEPH